MNLQTSLLLIVPAFVIFVLIIPVVIEVRFSFNPLQNRGTVAFYLFGKCLIYYIFSLHFGYITLQNKKETKIQQISFKGEDFEVLKEFSKEVKDKVKLTKLYVFYNMGAGDAFSSAMIAGLLNQICLQFFLVLKSKKPTASLCVYDSVSYNKEICELALRTKMSISVFDVFYSWLYSFLKVKYIT